MPALGELLQGGGGRGQHQGVGLVDQVDEPGWGGLQLAAAADELAAVQAGEVGAELVGGSDDQSMKGVHGLGAGFDGRGADHAQHADGLDGGRFLLLGVAWAVWASTARAARSASSGSVLSRARRSWRFAG
jgi:hypothetical protein